ncbi:Immunoglobulin A1 protease [Wickerhamomyces ciferrii]|uniref:Immunoglobulin A1 protease n=1 Tax=Wickerhamomyces ciferrii (strain ATCC 14091 / BCRC 22168 / CBS 111 / JCM 3599 / NBRC 0793 / NRRL Y-1031 F-60-10) TaxID=1206466 RepID=K0KH86_WICCF|nr:Immunoglobulin A1 protease [Wickerhamomyces ciferrii]CCH41542.1 Immunoglobulin A1 protease [Wickerhamomyces ciferrii]
MATFPSFKQDDYFQTQRTNSISSGSNHSINSTSNMSTMSTASHVVPRGSSTQDLLFMESKFSKPSRSKPQFKTFQNQSSVTSLNGYVLPPRIPRSSSVPSVPKLIPENPSERPGLPTRFHPGLKTSNSMHHVPAYRRQSLKAASEYNRSSLSIQQPTEKNQNQNQQPVQQPLQQQPYKRRHSARPGFHNAPFTFPNGEVYTPRNKQRNSQPNFRTFTQNQNNTGIHRNSSSPSLTSQHQQQFQVFNQQRQHPQRAVPRQQPPPLPLQTKTAPQQIQKQEQYITVPDANSHRSSTNSQHTEQDLALLTTGSNSFSSSPSPSRTSRTNSSVNESTPPSSIDDLTLHTTINNINGGKAELSQLPPPLQQLDSTGNLGKIEEHETKSSTPTSDSTQSQSTLDAVNGSTGQMNKENIEQPDHEFLKEQSKARANAQRQPKLSKASDTVTPTITVSQVPQVPQQKNFPTIAKPQVSAVNAPSSFNNNNHSEAAPQRKQSVLKRIFSKVFTSSDKKKLSSSKFSLKKKSSQATLNIKAPFRPELPTRSKTEPHLPQTEIKTETPPPLPKISTSDNVNDVKLTTEPDTSDVFSFMDGDEDEGIKVESEESSTKEFKSELVLDKLFSKLSTNESSEEVFKKITNGEKRTSRVLEEDNVSKKPESSLENKKIRGTINPKASSENLKPQDPEDYTIQFDDMEFIDKIIEYGETPFPNLKSTDLGQSERKLQRTRSIERKKSLRSVSSSSGRQLDEVIANSDKILQSKSDTHHIQVIYSNTPKDPLSMIKTRPSILKKRRNQGSIHQFSNSNGSNNSSTSLSSTSANLSSSNKKVGFTNQIFVNNTYPSYIYNRHSRSLSSYSLSFQLIQQIRHEMNDFKRSMTIHELSRGNTHYFRA